MNIRLGIGVSAKAVAAHLVLGTMLMQLRRIACCGTTWMGGYESGRTAVLRSDVLPCCCCLQIVLCANEDFRCQMRLEIQITRYLSRELSDASKNSLRCCWGLSEVRLYFGRGGRGRLGGGPGQGGNCEGRWAGILKFVERTDSKILKVDIRRVYTVEVRRCGR